MVFAKTYPSTYISGQKYTDCQTGTSNTPFTLKSFRCQIIELMQKTWGQSQFSSSNQLAVKH